MWSSRPSRPAGHSSVAGDAWSPPGRGRCRRVKAARRRRGPIGVRREEAHRCRMTSKRDDPSDPGPSVQRLVAYDAKEPGRQVPADRAAAAARRRPQRPGRAARRRRLRRLQRLRRPDQHPDRRAAGRRRPEVQPVPHHRAVLPDPPGAADRPQPSLGRHGRHHRDRHLGARLQLDPAQHGRPAGRDAEAERLLDRPVRQVPRGPGVADQPGWARSTPGRPAAGASSTSTASSAARPTSTTRRSTKAPPRSSPPRRPTRATT